MPAIPASRVDPVVEDAGLLIWLRSGTMTVGFHGHPSLRAEAGQAVWVPPGMQHWVDLHAGSVAVPLLLEHVVGSVWPDAATVVSLPDDWSAWVLHRLSRFFGFASGYDSDGQRSSDLFAGVRTTAADGAVPPLPPLPRSPGARRVVERLIRDPACSADLDQLAHDAHLSARTLQRRLTEETGCSLVRWRTIARVQAAAGHLARGRDLEWTAHRVGYATLSSFAHAFSSRVGISPGRYAARHALGPVDDVLGHLAVLGVVVAPAPPIPAAPPSPWITSFDGVLWVLRGTACVSVAGTRRELERGDVVWLSRGVAHEIEIGADSVVLPLGRKANGPPLAAGSLQVVRMPCDEETELFLLHTVVANHFLLRPPAHDDQSFLDLVHPDFPVPRELPPHLARLVYAVIEDPADRRSLTEWATDLKVDPGVLRRDFVACLGETFPRWRATARMMVARSLMWDGLAPTVVARRLGYTHVSAFTKAFSKAYGMPPSEWLRREAA